MEAPILTSTIQRQRFTISNPGGFTLLEMMVVLTILIFLAAMFYPAAGQLNNKERQRLTESKMKEIRRAIVGDPDVFDTFGERIIGGYVGDMEDWPGLYEPMPEVRQHVIGSPPVFDTSNANNLDYYLYRPAGHFFEKSWRWGYPISTPPNPYRVNTPYRLLDDDTVHNNDHIGGLETENEGQPMGLWTDNPIGDGTLLDDRWQGPYLFAPKDNKPENADHFATNVTMYQELDPSAASATGGWEDGDYTPVDGDLGEYFDEKEEFRLRQTEGRLADGWDRALRFFITQDPERTGKTIFWILSEGPDREGTYPTKGIVGATGWVADANDTMSTAYDEEDKYNKDNIVMKIYSHEWEDYFARVNQRKKEETEKQFGIIRRALVGDGSSGENGFNSGYAGALCRWPLLFQWEDYPDPAEDYWDNEDATPLAYTKGQPRGLWTDKPNSDSINGADDDLAPVRLSTPSIGWSGSYIVSPFGSLEDEMIHDAWGREVLFFMDDGPDDILHSTDDTLMILSRGPDGRFDFLATDTLPEGTAPDGTDDYYEPSALTESVDVSSYNPADSGGYNADNIVMLVRGTDWQPGWLQLEQFTVGNAITGVTKAMFVYGWDATSAAARTQIYVAGTDGALTGTDWSVGTAGAPAFDFSDISSGAAIRGTRALVFWNDLDGDNTVGTGDPDVAGDGEAFQAFHYNILGDSGLEPRSYLEIDTSNFTTAQHE